MAYKHGVYIQENPTSIIPPITSDSAVQVVIGTAPVHLAKNPYDVTNKPILANSFKEAVESLGYSDNWGDYSLCEVMDASFRQIGAGPIVFINVLDPTLHKASGTETVSFVNKEAVLQAEGILLDKLVLKSIDDATTYIKDTDYSVGFNSEGLVLITKISTTMTDEANATFERLDTSSIDETIIIGGYNTQKAKNEGIEAILDVFPRLGVIPGLILAPGWSHIPDIGLIIDAKCELINGSFNCMNLLDIDTNAVKSYQTALTWKNSNSYVSNKSILLWPKAKIGNKTYHLSSIIAALISYTDARNDNVPYVSPSNKVIPITATVLDDGTEVYLDQLQGNFLNGNGIMTAININGWRAWGNNTAAYPGSSDPKDRFIPIRRVFNWWGNTFILTYLEKVDNPANYRLIESIVDSENIRGNGLQGKGQIAGAKIEFRQSDNPATDILNGKIQFIQKIAAFTPAENITNVLEFDPTMLQNALFGGEQ